MRHRTQSKSAFDTRVDYVESKLDESIHNFKEAMQKSESGLKEMMQKSESGLKEMMAEIKETVRDNKEAMRQIEIRGQANYTELKASLEKMVEKAESSRRWAIGIVVTVAIAVIGSLITFIIFLFTYGLQILTYVN